MWTIGAVTVAFACALLAVGYFAPRNIPGRSYYNVLAQFEDADNLTNAYDVKIGGRRIGQVLDPEAVDGNGQVRLQLTPDVKPLLSDTTLRVRPRSAVGVRFVELVPGTRGTPLGEGDLIPAQNTSETVQLDEALNTFDEDRRAKAATLLNELGVGAAARGEDVNLALRDAPDFLADLEEVAGELNSRDGAPERLVRESGRAANAADPVRDVIASGFDPQSDALDVFSDHEDGLRDLLDTAPGALRTVRADLARTSPLLNEVRGMAAQLEPALRAGVPALRNTSTLLRAARPGLRELPDTLDLAETAVPPTTRVLNAVLPILPGLDKLFTEPLGLVDVLAPRGCDVTFFGDAWTSIMNNQVPNGGILRLNLQASQESLFGVTEKGKGLSGPVRTNPYPAPCQSGTEG